MYFVPSMVEVGEGENRTRGGGPEKGLSGPAPCFWLGLALQLGTPKMSLGMDL